jgi:hypothetical protein
MDTPSTEPDVHIPADVLADLEAVCRQLPGGKLDPELVRRIRERSDKAREETLRRFGVQDIGVSIIREMRDAR